MVNNRAARIISGCIASTPVEQLREAANLEPIHHRIEVLGALSYQKAMHNSKSPTKNTLEKKVRQRLIAHGTGGKKRPSWREANSNYTGTSWKMDPIITVPPRPPWDWENTTQFHSKLKEDCKRSEKDEERRIKAQNTLEEHSAEILIYTDGSVSENGRGGSGLIAYKGNTTIHQQAVPSGLIADSCFAECTAMAEAVKWAENSKYKSFLICSDSKSGIEKLMRGPGDQDDQASQEIWRALLRNKSKSFTFQWVPAHCGLEGNEKADRLAAEGTNRDQSQIAIPYRLTKSVIKDAARKKGHILRVRSTKISTKTASARWPEINYGVDTL